MKIGLKDENNNPLLSSAHAVLHHEARMQVYEVQDKMNDYIPSLVSSDNVDKDWDVFWREHGDNNVETKSDETKQQQQQQQQQQLQSLDATFQTFLSDDNTNSNSSPSRSLVFL